VRRASWVSWLAGTEALLLVVGVCGPAGAESPLAPLLKPLDLVVYRPDTPPPPLIGQTVDAQSISLATLRGRVLLVNFWASWCLECRPEMPILERLHRESAARGLAVIGVNAREDKPAIGRYARQLGLTFPLVLDRDGKINAQYGVIGLPTTFLIGRDGRAVASAIGAREWASPPGRALIDALLAEPTPHPATR